MYRVTVVTDGKEYLLHEPRDSDGVLQLIEPVLTLEVGKNGGFTFGIAPTHPNKDKIQALKSEILVYQDEDNIFAGRSIGDESDFYNKGAVTCEGELAYLIDSIQRPYSFTGGGTEFFKQLLDVHNSQVEERKQFLFGSVTVADIAPEIQRENKDCANTLKTMRSQLVERNGGYLRVRRDNGKKYLDYVNDYGGINSQVIRFGENLLDLSRYTKPTGIITALIPYGATVESKNAETKDKPVDITSVNGGKDYIFDQAAVDTYGWIWGTQTFDDITDPAALLAKSEAYLQECIALPTTLDLKAVDLSLIDVDVQKLQLGYWTQVESVPHGISKRFLLSKKMIHLDNPGKDEIILGQTLPAFTASANKDQVQISERIDRVAASTSREINKKVENATLLITGGKGGYVVLDVYDPDTGKKTHPWRILVMDTPDKETAKSVIQINKNGMGFSRTGVNGPYTNAWTIDGNLVADFITTGTMLADRIRGGTLELGGTGLGKDGAIIVKDASGNRIGAWDKTGLSVLRGILQGVSAIFGGVDNQYGAIEIQNASGRTIGRWDKNGIYIMDGDISVGPFSATSDGVYFGDFYVSADGSNSFQSEDGSVMLQTQGGPSGDYPALVLTESASQTIVSGHAIQSPYAGLGAINGDVRLDNANGTSNWWAGYTIFEALDWLYEKIQSIGGSV